jgi:hypothetical protein
MGDLRTDTAALIDDIARWRAATAPRAPSYQRLLGIVVDLLEGDSSSSATLAERFHRTWASRTFLIFYERPLLLLASLRMDALTTGTSHPLFAALAAPEPDPTNVTERSLLAALAQDSVWTSMRTRFVQTNETSRAVAWLWPAKLIGCDDGARPVTLVEIGTAAGLNLVADRLASPWTTSSGERLATVKQPNIIARQGIDLEPLDACTDEGANWLRACVWAGERDRLARLEAAIDAFRASPAKLIRGDATDAPGLLRSASAKRTGREVVLAFQTIMRDYLPAATRATYEREMRSWLAESSPGSAIWLELELDHSRSDKLVPIVAHVRSDMGVIDLVLGTTGYHPNRVDVDDAAVARLSSELAPRLS